MSGQRQAIAGKSGIKVLADQNADLGVEKERASAYNAFANDFKEVTGDKAVSMDMLLSMQGKELN